MNETKKKKNRTNLFITSNITQKRHAYKHAKLFN